MPKLGYRKIYDDDGEEMLDGSLVLVNSKYTRVLYFNDNDEIDIADFRWEDVETIEKLPDDRYEEIHDPIVTEF